MIEARRYDEKANQCLTQARAMLDRAEKEGRELTAEEETQFQDLHAEAERAVAMRERLKSQEAAERRAVETAENERRARARAEQAAITDPDSEAFRKAHTAAFRRWMRVGIHGLKPEERGIMSRTFRSLSPEDLAGTDLETRVMGTDASGTPFGGYSVPASFMARLEAALKAWNGIFAAPCEQIRTASGSPMTWPTADDTAELGELLAEGTATDQDQDLVFGRVIFDAFTYSSKIIRVQRQLLQDSGLDLEAVIANAAGERLGRITAEHLVNGDGTAKPRGIVTAAANSTVAFSLGTPTVWEDVIDLIHSIDPAYRMSPGFGLAMSDSGLAYLRKVKDSNGQPLWNPGGVAENNPPTLAGARYYILNQMPAPTGTNKAFLVGDLSRYKIRRVLDATMLRLDERYAEYLQVGFLVFLRLDGDLIAANSVKYAVMAA
jgi:HK97 family phage major capsid protein